MNMNLVWIGVIFSIASTFLLVKYYGEILSGKQGHVFALAALFLSIVSSLSLFVVYRQWAILLNENTLNTKKLAESYGIDLKGIPLVPNWTYFAFVLFWFLSFLFPEVWLFSLLQVVFFVTFLHFLFEAARHLQEEKARLYRTLFDVEFRPIIKERNVLSVLLLTLITLGVYWLYLIVELSKEINEFLDADERTMKNLEVKL
ncbi:DUF4234 domain-containing protein [Thermotoga sp. SG1]|uniref:DUF4234 domain-containing protein n=1 Tax=Thermotoga sp. SG1 TaxID=126739 RepID=UPI001E51E607|nr:DUF4234 domain-containing protein [Thermotoga sp. SG1]